MKSYSRNELEEAKFAIGSTISKCEKALQKFSEKSPQNTLLTKRIKALVISRDLIDKAILELNQLMETTNH